MVQSLFGTLVQEYSNTFENMELAEVIPANLITYPLVGITRGILNIHEHQKSTNTVITLFGLGQIDNRY
jgi:hypothetical protein